MKNKLLLLLILGVTFFAACSDDDDDQYPVVGKWNLPELQVDNSAESATYSGIVTINWQAAADATIMGVSINDVVAPLMNNMCNMLLPQVLKDVTFQGNGQIVATYSDAEISLGSETPATPTWKESPAKYLGYKIVSGTKMALFPNIMNILKEANLDLSQLEQLQLTQEELAKLMAFIEKVTKNGVEVTYTLSEQDHKLRLTVDKKVMDGVMEIVPIILKAVMQDPNLDSTVSTILTALAPSLPEAWAKTTAFEIHLDLKK